MPKMNSKYFAYASKSFDLALMAGVIAIVLIGGYIVIQSIFRISINDKIRSYGQLRTIGALSLIHISVQQWKLSMDCSV